MEIRKLKNEEFYELRNFLTTVFTEHNKKETDFEKLFPRIFGELNEYATDSHYGVFENKKLIGTAAMYQLDYVVGSEHIKLIANGNVAVDENHRGKGVMSALLKKINEECDKCADVCYLHGNPDLYGRFGYYKGEKKYLLIFEPKTVSEYIFREMRKTDVPMLQKISRSKTEYIKRKDFDFICALKSCYRDAITVLNNKEQLIGYMSFDREHNHVEEFAFTGEMEHEVFQAFAKSISSSVEVLISGYDRKMYDRLKDYGKEISKKKEDSTLFRIINPERMHKIARLVGLDENTLYAPYLT